MTDEISSMVPPASVPVDDDHGGDDRGANLWWAVHKPETLALAALVIAVALLMFTEPLQEFATLAFFNTGNGNIRDVYGTMAGIRLGMCVFALALAVMSIRSEDDDATWSPPVARAALIVGGLAALLAIATLFAVLATTPQVPGFTSPSQ
jgi:uncharacterized membrane protein